MSHSEIRFPTDTNRHSIIGRTGSGKTQAGVWHLSRREFNKMPWIVFDVKGDTLIQEIPFTDQIPITGKPPKKPGLFVTRPHPNDTEELELFLNKVWENENTGLYIDEGYLMGQRSRGFRAILTQGRSKRIPLIILSQKPLWLDRFVFSESEFFQVFHLQDTDDHKVVRRFVRGYSGELLPEYHSTWYDVAKDRTFTFGPVPSQDEILDRFDIKTRPVRKFL